MIGEVANFALNGLFLGAIYGLLAMPMSVVWATTDVVDISTGGYAVVAGIVAAHLGFPYGPFVGIAAATAVGVIAGLIFIGFQAVKGDRNPILMVLGSFGLLLVIESAVLVSAGTAGRFLPRIGGLFVFGPIVISTQNLINLSISIILMVGLVTLLKRTSMGLSMRASAISTVAAQLSGVAVRLNQFTTFVLGATVAGIAGVLAVMTIGMAYSSAFTFTVAAFSGAIVLGLKGPATAFAGGMLIGIAESISHGYLPAGWAVAVPSMIIVIVLASGRLPDAAFTGVRP